MKGLEDVEVQMCLPASNWYPQLETLWPSAALKQIMMA